MFYHKTSLITLRDRIRRLYNSYIGRSLFVLLDRKLQFIIVLVLFLCIACSVFVPGLFWEGSILGFCSGFVLL